MISILNVALDPLWTEYDVEEFQVLVNQRIVDFLSEGATDARVNQLLVQFD